MSLLQEIEQHGLADCVFNRKNTLLTYWLFVFNEQMSNGDDDWQELDFDDAPSNLHFRLWLATWGEDSRGKLLNLILDV
jgi:hypothetical protein